MRFLMRKYNAVLFDLGGTLIKTVEVAEICRRILKIHGIIPCFEDIAEAYRDNEEEFNVDDMVKFGDDFWIKWNLRLLEKLGINENKEFLAKKLDQLWWNHAELEAYSDVLETLTYLKNEGVKTGIVTNAFERDYQQILQKLSWTDQFDAVVGIDSCNKAKPDREIFICALEKLRVNPEETIFVGDSVKYDFEGAKKAGLRPLIINREAKASANVETIASLTELLDYI
jgi:phosphoglycolate phosphatase